MQWYFTSDWHLNHSNIIKYCKRPFLSSSERELVEASERGLVPIKSVHISRESVEQMNEAIIQATNQVAGEDDNLVILGDFCWSSTPKDEISKLVSRLKCKNRYLVWGNHDNRQTFLPFFKATYDYHVFRIEGQNIFTTHYPCKSWPHSSYGSWMLYGHVHNRLSYQDNGDLSQHERANLKFAIEPFLEKFCAKGFVEADLDAIISDIGSIFRKKSFSLDVGVDNIREGIPFGTPWSFEEIKFHMEKKLISNVSI